jgi:predicted nucleic acid-binding protein
LRKGGLMIGLDTGFFLELLKGHQVAVTIWTAGLSDEADLIVSCLSLFEIERLGLKGAIQGGQVILESVSDMCRVVWLNQDVLSQGARFSHGLGIPAMDSLILASLVLTGCTEIYTTDSHIEAYRSSTVTVRNLRGHPSPSEVE